MLWSKYQIKKNEKKSHFDEKIVLKSFLKIKIQ